MHAKAETAAPEVNLKHLPHELDAGLGARASIGLVVLSSDQTIEHEYRRLVNLPGVAVYQTRISNDNAISPDSLRAMEARITASVDLLLPGMPMDVIGYGCTSASMLIGEQRVMAMIHAARPDALCTTPITAAKAAFEQLAMERIALLTPYSDEINEEIRAYLEAGGIRVPVMGSFNVHDDRQACRIAPASVRDAAIRLGSHAGVDGVFVSCTALRVAEVVEEIETALGKPATASNHAMAWHSLRLAGINEPREGLGRLYRI